MPAPSRSLLRHSDFRKLWTAETVSVFGDAITGLAGPIIAASVLNVTALEFSLLNAVGVLPFIVLSLPAGVWVDRMLRRPILIAADLGRAAAIATIPLAFALGTLSIWQLYAVALVVGALTVFFDIAYQSYLPSLVERQQLVDANGKLQITQSAASILGPGLAGLLIGTLGAPLAMLLDAASFVGSAGFLGWIRRPEPPVERPDPTADRPRPSMRFEIRGGLGFVLGHPWLRAIAATTGLSNLFGQIANAIFLLYVIREQGLSAEQVGVALSIGSVGFLAGALLAGRLARWLGLGRALVLAALGFPFEWLIVAVAPGALILPAVVVSVMIGGFCGVVWNVNQVSLRQAITPPRMQGRMNASMRFIVWGTIPVGAVAGGVLGSLIGLQPAMLAGALGNFAAILPVALSPVRSLRTMPAAIEDD